MYNTILCSLDFYDDNHRVFERAVHIAKSTNAKLILTHVKVDYNEMYAGLLSLDFDSQNKFSSEHIYNQLEIIKNSTDYKNIDILVCHGELVDSLSNLIEQEKVDLLVVGHNIDFWSKIISNAKRIINNIEIDTLIVPLKRG